MFRWHRVLVCSLLGSLISTSAYAYPIRVNFTVLGSLSDPYTANATATGYFIFDSSLIPYGGGTIWANYPPGLQISKLSFTWAGHSWTEADAFTNILYFDPDGSLTGFSIQAKVTPGSVNGDIFPDFAIDVHGSESFSYSSPARTSAYAGLVMSWDAAAVPIVLAAGGDHGWHVAVDSNGKVYRYSEPSANQPLLATTYIGNLFGGPPPSPIVQVIVGINEIVYGILENGDVWRLSDPPVDGSLIGNILLSSDIVAVGEAPTPSLNRLSQNRPNPFNPTTRIPYRLGSKGRITIRVFDISGRLVRTLADTNRTPGDYVAVWNGQNEQGEATASGTYFARITYPDGTTAEQKMTVLR